MKTWQEALVPLVCLLALGCRPNPNIVLLERENRELEDTIYELQDCLDKYQRNLEAYQRSNASLQTKLSGTSSSTAAPSATPSATPSETPPREEPTVPPPRRKSQPIPPVPAEELQPPKVELPPVTSPSDELPEVFRTPSAAPKTKGTVPPKAAPPAGPAAPGASPSLDLPPATSPSKSPSSARTARTGNARVAKISLDPRFTGGYDQDGHSGDDGVTVAIQPRDAQGRLCPVPAPISVVVWDTTTPGNATRVARWDFSADEVAAVLRDSDPKEGIRLAMPWPEGRPSHRQLQLFARYTTDAGQKLQADCPIAIALNAQQANNWEPALLPGADEPADSTVAAQPMPIIAPRSSSPAAPTGRAAQGPVSTSATETARPTWSPDRR